ncbi:MAG: hypothetical protein MK135_16420 [Polyangiaceae bacterium]|nr:hypothetical protein [Polyangiaceae bacterium]
MKESHRAAVVIDHEHATIHEFIGETEQNFCLRPSGQHRVSRQHLTHKKEGHFRGGRVPEDKQYYEEIAKHLRDAQEIVIFGHGKGHSAAKLVLLKDLIANHNDIAEHVVALETVGSDTAKELEAEAKKIFHDVEHRRALGLPDKLHVGR